MSVSKIQIGQLWKKDGTGDIYLVTRLYSEALNTMVILRKSGAEGEAQIRVRVDRAGRSEEHTSELQSQSNLVCRLLLEKKKTLPIRSLHATTLNRPIDPRAELS